MPRSRAAALSIAAILGSAACGSGSEPGSGDEPETPRDHPLLGTDPAADRRPVIDDYEATTDRDVQVRFGDTGTARRDPGRGGRELARRRLLQPGAGRDRTRSTPRGCSADCPPTSSTGSRRSSGPATAAGSGSRPGPGCSPTTPTPSRASELPDSPLELTEPRVARAGSAGRRPTPRCSGTSPRCARSSRRRGRPRVARGHGRQRDARSMSPNNARCATRSPPARSTSG